MLLIQSVGGQCLLFTYPSGAAATTYFVFKNGTAIGFGTGTIFNSGSPGSKFAIVTLSGADVNTLGTLQVALIDGAGNILAGDQARVVVDVPGGKVSEVTGNVDGNVSGFVTVHPLSRVAIATNVWTLPDMIELGLSAGDAMKCLFSVLAGKTVVAPLAAQFRNFGDTKNRVSMTFDTANQRIVVTYDFS